MEQLNIFNNSFINEGFKVYLTEQKSTKYHKHSVFSHVIKQLVLIYGEDKIIEPFINNQEEDFTKNLQTYGFSLESIIKWLRAAEAFYRDNKMPNYFFELIQEGLIDMYIYRVNKKKEMSDKEEFEKLLYTDNCPNLMIRLYNLLHNKNIKSINAYWQQRLFELENPIEFAEPITYLEPKLYQLYGLTIDEVKKMSINDVTKINTKILASQKDGSGTSGGTTKKSDNVKKLVFATN